MALVAASWAFTLVCVALQCCAAFALWWQRLGVFAPAPRLWVWVLPPFGHARTRAPVAAPLVCARPSAAAPHVLAFRLRARAFAPPPLAVARARPRLLPPASPVRALPRLPPRGPP